MDECGGLTALEKLENHVNTKVYDKAVELIEKYFGVEEESMGDI